MKFYRCKYFNQVVLPILPEDINNIYNWLVVEPTPLKSDGVRQLGS